MLTMGLIGLGIVHRPYYSKCFSKCGIRAKFLTKKVHDGFVIQAQYLRNRKDWLVLALQ